jgi:hypothetical protein
MVGGELIIAQMPDLPLLNPRYNDSHKCSNEFWAQIPTTHNTIKKEFTICAAENSSKYRNITNLEISVLY